MPPEGDVKDGSESSTEQGKEKATADKTLETSEASTEKDGEEESDSPANKRIRQLHAEASKAKEIVDWYRKNIGDPKDVVAFNAWKKDQVKKAEEAEDEGEISPAKLAAIRKLMRAADPEYRKYLEKAEQREQAETQEKQARIDAQFDEAEDVVREFAEAEMGLKGPKVEADISFFAQQTMLIIQNDEKMLRQWNAGHNIPALIKKACGVVLDRADKTNKSIAARKREAAEKRKFSRLPSLPSGGASTTGATTTSPQKEKGITKQTHEDAWAVLQQSLRET